MNISLLNFQTNWNILYRPTVIGHTRNLSLVYNLCPVYLQHFIKSKKISHSNMKVKVIPSLDSILNPGITTTTNQLYLLASYLILQSFLSWFTVVHCNTCCLFSFLYIFQNIFKTKTEQSYLFQGVFEKIPAFFLPY